MLSKNEIVRLTTELRIDRERIIREFYEMLLLNEIAQNSWSQWLVFKGGTALRLAYQSPRFSDDLDFGMIQPIIMDDFSQFILKTASKYKLLVTDCHEKLATILAEFKISTPTLPQPFHLKIEISKRPQLSGKTELKILFSPVCSLQILIPVLTMESMITEKIAAWNERQASRDLFDLWFLSQKMNQSFDRIVSQLNITGVNRASLRSELNKYLPLNWRRVSDEMDQIIQSNQ